MKVKAAASRLVPFVALAALLAALGGSSAAQQPFPVWGNNVLPRQAPARNAVPKKSRPPRVTDNGHVSSYQQGLGRLARIDDDQTYQDTGDPVAPTLGLVSHRVVDLNIPGRGLDFTLERSYNSHCSDTDGPLGFGWDHSYNIRLTSPNGGATINLLNGDNCQDTYTQVSPTVYSSAPGIYTLFKFDTSSNTYTVRNREGVKTHFDILYRVTRIEDPAGNALQFFYDGALLDHVLDTMGRRINFHYTANHLDRVTDFRGRQVLYFYDANGNLSGVRTPTVTSTSGFNDFSAGRVEAYTYLSDPGSVLDHKLTSIVHPNDITGITPPSGTPFVQFTYETGTSSPFFGWCKTQYLGGTNAAGAAGGTISYSYAVLDYTTPFSDLNARTIGRIRGTVTNRKGFVTDYISNQDGNVIQVIDHEGSNLFTTTNEYNADGELTSITQPRGNQSAVTYDSSLPLTRGNITSITDSVGSISSSLSPRTTILEYEPIFNNLRSETDCLQHVTSYTTDYEEGLDDEGSADDVIASLQAELLGLFPRAFVATLVGDHLLDGHDVNGDGSDATVHGNVIAIHQNNATVTELGGAPLSILYGKPRQDSTLTRTFNAHGQITSETDDEENVTVYLYYPETDPDGDGTLTSPSTGLDTITGGYLKRTIQDTTLPYADPSPEQQLSGVVPRSDLGRDSGQDPTPINAKTDYGYNRSGALIWTVDPRGVKYEFSVNELDEVWKQVRAASVSPGGRGGGVDGTDENLSGQAFAYDEIWKRDANGNTIAHFVQNSGGTADAVAATGAPTNHFESYWTYDILDNPRTESREYGFVGEPLATWTFGYDANENRDAVTFPEGNTKLYTWDFRDQMKSITRGSGQEASQVTFYRDDNGNLLQYVDGRNLATTIAYDGFDRVSTVTQPAGTEKRLTYDAQNNVTVQSIWGRLAGPSSAILELQRTLYTYDERDRLVQIDRVDPQSPLTDGALTPNDARVTTVFEHDRTGRTVFQIDDDASQTERRFDGASRVIKTIDPVGNVTDVKYDDNGNPIKATDSDKYPNSTFRTFEAYDVFDSLNRRRSTTDNIGRTERFTYDSRDNVVQHSDAVASLSSEYINGHQINNPGNTTTLTVDGLGRVVIEDSALRVGGTGDGAIDAPPYNTDGHIVRTYTYNKNSSLRFATDDRGKTTEYQYDTCDRLKATLYADTTQLTQHYDGNDNVTSWQDAIGNVVTNTFDYQNRLTAIDAAIQTPTVGSTQLRYEYDGLDRLTKSTDSVDASLQDSNDWVNEHTWDALGRKRTYKQNNRTVTTTWIEEAKKTSVAYPSAVAVQYTYDALERVKTVTQGTQLASYDYAGKNRLLQRHDAGGVDQRFYTGTAWDDTLYYDGARRPIKVDFKSSTTLVTGLEYGFDRADNRLFVRRLHDNSEGDNYVYDSKYRLWKIEREVDPTKVGIPGSNLFDVRVQYDLDGVHNRRRVTRAQRTGVGISTKATDYALDNVNNYVSKQQWPAAAVVQSFDANGNKLAFTQQGTHATYKYDFLNRLRVIEQGTSKVEFDYDAEGRRVRSKVTNLAGYPASTEFVHDGPHVIEEVDGSSGSTLRRFYYGDGLDELVGFDNLSFYPGTGTYFYEQDPHGDVVAIHGSSGNVVERYTYAAFGAPEFDTPGNVKKSITHSDYGNPYCFQGLRHEWYFDELYYCRARFIDSTDGTFMQRDPIGIWGDWLNFGHPKAYCAGNPQNLRDPLGLGPDVRSLCANIISGIASINDAIDSALDSVFGSSSDSVKEFATENPGITVGAVLVGGTVLAAGAAEEGTAVAVIETGTIVVNATLGAVNGAIAFIGSLGATVATTGAAVATGVGAEGLSLLGDYCESSAWNGPKQPTREERQAAEAARRLQPKIDRAKGHGEQGTGQSSANDHEEAVAKRLKQILEAAERRARKKG